MKNRSKIILLGAAVSAFLCGCAKEKTESEADSIKREFEAWMSLNYPGATASGRGVYIINDVPGTGDAISPGTDKFAIVRFVWKDLDKNIETSTEETLAKQLGKYKEVNYYGPVAWAFYPQAIYAGFYDAISGMRTGGTREFISPSWLNTYSDYPSEEQYLKKYKSDECHDASIVKVTLLDKTSDIVRYQIDSIERYIVRNMGSKRDSAFLGYYYIRTQAPADEESLKDSTVYINYTGRLLNGKVFDTTIEDTARLHNIYDASKTYEPQKVYIGESVDKVSMGSNASASSSSSGAGTTNITASGLVRGFAYTLFNMKHYEKGTCIFVSSYGYSSSGSGRSIPAYSPLRFDIELVDKP